MNLAEWRMTRQAELDLPSGLHVKLRRVSLVDIAMTGELPTPLLAAIEELDGKTLTAQSVTEQVELYRKLAPALDAVAKAALISPAIGETSDAEHIRLDELSVMDRMEIFGAVTQEARRIAPLFPESGTGQDTGQPGAEVQHESGGPSGD